MRTLLHPVLSNPTIVPVLSSCVVVFAESEITDLAALILVHKNVVTTISTRTLTLPSLPSNSLLPHHTPSLASLRSRSTVSFRPSASAYSKSSPSPSLCRSISSFELWETKSGTLAEVGEDKEEATTKD